MATVYRKNGLYLKYNKHSNHTGTHRTSKWVEDLQQATVFYCLPPYQLRTEELVDAEVLEAKETRTVELVEEPLLTDEFQNGVHAAAGFMTQTAVE